MSESTKIEWANHTGGPWLICSMVSAGCTNCYAMQLMLTRLGPLVRKAYKAAGFEDWATRPIWGDKATRVLTKGFWEDARRINAQHAKAGTRGRWFPSMIDWLDKMPAGIIDQDGNKLDPIAVLADLLKLIYDTPNLDWLLLTKRPENFHDLLLACISHWQSDNTRKFDWIESWINSGPFFPHNVWIGTSVEDQQCANERIPELLKIPAKVRFLSVEPMLGPVDLSQWIGLNSPNERRTFERQDSLRSGKIRGIANQTRRDDLEIGVPAGQQMEGWDESNMAHSTSSGARHRAVLGSKGDGQQQTREHGGAQVSVSPLPMPDSARANNQPQGRTEEKQPPYESGSGELRGADTARSESIGEDGSTRSEKQSLETDRGGSKRDTASEKRRPTTQNSSDGIRDNDPAGISNRQRPEMGISWIIVGGESGPGARPCNVAWVRDIVKQCRAAYVPCFVKQLGARPTEPIYDCRNHPLGEQGIDLKHPKGGDMEEWPSDLRVREFPL